MFKGVCLILTLIMAHINGVNISDDIERIDLKLKEQEIAFTFLSLSSGEATLVQDAQGDNILINTGGPETQEELKVLLKTYNIKKLKYVVITKDDIQYTSNLDFVMTEYDVESIIVGEHAPNYQKGNILIPKITWKKDQKYELLPGLSAKILHETINKNNIAEMDILFQYEKTYILFMSSSNKSVEKQLKGVDLSDVDIYKVAEFGTGEGATQDFVSHIDPQVAIIFNKNNIAPNHALVERLHETWIDVYILEQFGNVTIRIDDTQYKIITISLQSIAR
ncbi:hypothetical protein EJF36_11175 [Bacillus sp. HMF5848]|uniref:ComEC/Rec2 family competence protein n=1 Tax=Bacillus sp. HMF5848 TaxID=2495421 RepID=UPI000F76CA94|nr:hypothetical protein [Bacillus sp. HMF5848]RSK27401.1 hypothetical protein EJF36_11175 [Bacillus sp. HMF5848]